MRARVVYFVTWLAFGLGVWSIGFGLSVGGRPVDAVVITATAGGGVLVLLTAPLVSEAGLSRLAEYPV